MDENKAHCIQVRVINLLTFWMKEYFMEDFNEVTMLQQLKNFIHKIGSLKQKQRLSSIPFDDTPSNIPSIPSINDDDNNVYQKLINHKQKQLGSNHGCSPVINNHHLNNQNEKFTVNRNPLHLSNINHSIISDGTNSMKTEQMEQIGNQIHQIHCSNNNNYVF